MLCEYICLAKPDWMGHLIINICLHCNQVHGTTVGSEEYTVNTVPIECVDSSDLILNETYKLYEDKYGTYLKNTKWGKCRVLSVNANYCRYFFFYMSAIDEW